MDQQYKSELINLFDLGLNPLKASLKQSNAESKLPFSKTAPRILWAGEKIRFQKKRLSATCASSNLPNSNNTFPRITMGFNESGFVVFS